MPPKKKKGAKGGATKKKGDGISDKEQTGLLKAQKTALETKYSNSTSTCSYGRRSGE